MSREIYKTVFKEEVRILNKRLPLMCESDINHTNKLEKMKILVVDDSMAIRDMLFVLLTSEGHEIVKAGDGQKGLEMIENNTFDAVLLDLLMPGYSGLDVIDSLEKTGQIKLNKIILMTAASISDVELNDLRSKGTHMWIRKPIDYDKLMNVLGNISPKKKRLRIKNFLNILHTSL